MASPLPGKRPSGPLKSPQGFAARNDRELAHLDGDLEELGVFAAALAFGLSIEDVKAEGDGFPNIGQCLPLGAPLGVTAFNGGTRDDVESVFVFFPDNHFELHF